MFKFLVFMRSLHFNKYSKKAATKKYKNRLQNLTQIWVLKNSLNWYCSFNVTHTKQGIATVFNGLMISRKNSCNITTTFDVKDA